MTTYTLFSGDGAAVAVSQEVTREGGRVRIRVALAPGTLPWPDRVTKVELPEPVEVRAGDWVTAEAQGVPETHEGRVALRMTHDATLTGLYFCPPGKVTRRWA